MESRLLRFALQHVPLLLAALLLSTLCPGRVACPEEETGASDAPAVRAAAVRQAVSEGDEATLKRLAECAAPRPKGQWSDLRHSPWPIVHDLIVRGHRKDAHALLGASSAKRLDPLRRYLRSIERRNPSRKLWEARNELARMADEGSWYELSKLPASTALADAGRTVPGIELQLILGQAHRELDYYAAAVKHFDLAAQGAHAIGWWEAEEIALQQWMRATLVADDAAGLLRCTRRRMELAASRGDRVGMARARADVGSALGELQQFEAALTEYRTVLDEYGDVICETTRIHVLSQMALAESNRGHFSDGQRFALRALDLVRAAARPPKPVQPARLRQLEGWTLETLGVIYSHTGDFDEARASLGQAMAIARETQDPLWAAQILGNQGVVELWSGDLEAAHELMQRAHAAYGSQGQAEHAARAEANLGEIERRLAEETEDAAQRGRYLKTALARLTRAYKAQLELEDTAGLCETLGEIALVLLRQGKGQKALARADAALGEALRISAIDLEVEALTTLARIHEHLGNHRKALVLAVDAAKKLSFLFDRLPPGQAALARHQTAPVYEVGLAAAVALGLTEEAWFFLESGRAGALLLALEDRGKIKRATVPEPLLRAEAEARMHVALAYEDVQREERGDDLRAKSAAHKALEARRNEHKRAVQRIQLEQAEIANLIYPSPAPVSEVRDALAPDEALVLFGRTGNKLVSLIVSKDKTRLVDHGAYDELTRICLGLRFGRNGPVDQAVLESLRAKVVDPLGLAVGVRRVLVSPMECLAYHPLGLLFPTRAFAAIPSAMSWMRLQAREQVVSGPVLALGDPAYEAVPAGWEDAPRDRGGGLMRLPATAEESRRVAGRKGDEVLLGRDASETNLRARLAERRADPDGGVRRLRALHLACHGLVNEDRPSFSGLVLSSSKEDDGLLTVVEICGLRIPADLVVLSACDSGTGRHQSAEGVLGLMRAFQVAGCRQVIASLWKVDDEASRALMIRFHELWNAEDPKQRLGAAAALRAAQAYVRDYAKHHDGKHPEWKHPHYWAAWQLWGPAD